MVGRAEARLLDDGRRLHLHHGPIDLVIGAKGEDREIVRAYAQARDRFEDVLGALVDELAMLRTAVAAPRWRPDGPVAKRMMAAAWPHRGRFVTPMAAVAGAVADEILAAMVAGRALAHGWVNNSGDIAFHLADGEALSLGLVGDLHRPAIDGLARLTFDARVRGIATSGWAGRSHSLGIADSVTVLAATAAGADVAATLIANRVDAQHGAILRRAANALDDDTDLGDRLVTVAVGVLDADTVDAALERGAAAADTMRRAGHIAAAVLVLQGESRAIGDARGAIAA